MPDLESLKLVLREFAAERDWDQFHSPKNLAMALSVEAGEVVEILQWLSEEESGSLSDDDLRAIRDEIGDVMNYLVRLADKLDIDPVAAAHDKVTKNRLKYPVELSRGRSDKYTRLT